MHFVNISSLRRHARHKTNIQSSLKWSESNSCSTSISTNRSRTDTRRPWFRRRESRSIRRRVRIRLRKRVRWLRRIWHRRGRPAPGIAALVGHHHRCFGHCLRRGAQARSVISSYFEPFNFIFILIIQSQLSAYLFGNGDADSLLRIAYRTSTFHLHRSSSCRYRCTVPIRTCGHTHSVITAVDFAVFHSHARVVAQRPLEANEFVRHTLDQACVC